MKKRIFLTAVIVMLFTCVAAVSVNATVIDSGQCGKDVTWSLQSDGTLTVSGIGMMDDYDEELNNDEYISSAPWGIYADEIHQVVICDGVKSIGNYAFYACSEIISFPDLPDSITYIGDYAFNRCDSLSGDFNLPDSVFSIGDYAFCGCSGFSGDLIIPYSAEEIGEYAFAECRGFGNNLIIDRNIRSIGSNAFINCDNISNVYFKGDAPNVFENTFDNRVRIYYRPNTAGWSDGNWEYYTADVILTIEYGTCGTDAYWMLDIDNTLTIYGSGSMDDYGYDEELETYTDQPWYDNTKDIRALIIENGITYIGSNSFERIESIKGELIIPDSVSAIGDSAFSNCTGFTGDLEIPDSVYSIGDNAFYNCAGITGTMMIPGSLQKLCANAFMRIGCSSISADTLYYKSKDGILYNSDYTEIVFCLFSKTGTLTIPDTVTGIGNYAFAGCNKLTGNLVIPNNVTSIGDFAFMSCNGFTGNLTIPDSVTSI